MKSKNKKLKKPSATTTKSKNSTKDILRIDWADHFTGNYQWTHVEDMDFTPRVVCSVGVKIHEDDKVIALAQNMVSDVRGADVVTIIKSCIVKTTKLGELEFQKS